MKSATNRLAGFSKIARQTDFSILRYSWRRPVAEHQRLFLVVGDEDGGDAERPGGVSQLDLQGFAQLPVKRAKRLLKQQDPRSDDDGARQCHPLLLTTGGSCGIQ